ncbi:MAG: proton-conducting membrane transporter [Rickettsiaceae bacterium]|nr:proton-conducting membrane transporter [Rickettsiaceae bacterium]
MINNFLNFFCDCNKFALIMIGLVAFISLCVGSFASRYMKGDNRYQVFFVQLILLIITVVMMVCTDNLIILLIAWCLSNVFLVRLMIHKPNWDAAKASGIIAAKNYFVSACLLGSAFMIFYLTTGQISISNIIHYNSQSTELFIALLLILIAAMMQSAIWPFHGWLISSLNSPTPVSAIMHAGLINGGGFLLIRFAPLYLQHDALLTLIFAIGLITALLGTLWKLMQNDVKRMLACSTMGQMGFMFVQCGLGLFPAAAAHLVWHGMFKAYLFLRSSSAAHDKCLDLGYPPQFLTFTCSLFCGFVGSIAFNYASCKSCLANNTTLVLIVIAFITLSQFALTMLRFRNLTKLPITLIATVLFGVWYGFNVQIIAWIMAPMELMQPQPLNFFHIIGIMSLIITWLFTLFFEKLAQTTKLPSWILKLYVVALNASQPHPSTVTTYRTRYNY